MKFRAKIFGFQVYVFIIVIAALISICSAQPYPSRAIDIIVPFAAGGGVDTFSRTIREALSKELRVPVNIVNRTGGGGVVGSSFVANSKADGYTLLVHEIPGLLLSQIMTPKIPFQVLKDFDPIASCATVPNLAAVRADSEFRTIEELILYAKKNPGKLIGGSPGVGTLGHFNLELLKSAAGINITHLPLSGGGEAIPNLLGGHIDLTVLSIGVLTPHMNAGKVRALVTMTAERIAAFPEIPTTHEKGIPQVNINMTLCLFGPKGLPLEVTEKLARATSEALKSPEVVLNLKRFNYTISFSGPNQFRERLGKDFSFFLDLAKKIGVAKIQD